MFGRVLHFTSGMNHPTDVMSHGTGVPMEPVSSSLVIPEHERESGLMGGVAKFNFMRYVLDCIDTGTESAHVTRFRPVMKPDRYAPRK